MDKRVAERQNERAELAAYDDGREAARSFGSRPGAYDQAPAWHKADGSVERRRRRRIALVGLSLVRQRTKSA